MRATGIRAVLGITALVCLLVVFWRAWHGPYSVHSPMNAEGIFALALLGLALASPGDAEKFETMRRGPWPELLALLVMAAFAPFLGFPFLADDYDHIWNARHIDFAAIRAHFLQPETDRFFRPLVYLFFGFEAGFAGLEPTVWRAVNLLWHLAASLLVFYILLELTPRRFAAFAGAALFAVHGSRPEAVTWVAALFDLMATALGLGGLLLILRGRIWFSCALLFLALLSKESAFVFPLLAVALFWYKRKPYRPLLPWFGIAGVVFFSRLAVLGEIGGYHDAGDGRPTIFHLRLATTMKGLFVRSWAALIVPLNWVSQPDRLLAITLLLALGALVWLAWRGSDRRLLILGIAMVMIAALPVHQFLSIGDDLEKSRVLYLPSVGLAVVFAALVRSRSGLAIGFVLLFQVFALRHNLAVWKSVGELAARTCESVPIGAAVPDMPNVVDGVYFLKTGFPACVWLARPGSDRIPATVTMHWDGVSRTVVRRPE